MPFFLMDVNLHSKLEQSRRLGGEHDRLHLFINELQRFDADIEGYIRNYSVKCDLYCANCVGFRVGRSSESIMMSEGSEVRWESE